MDADPVREQLHKIVEKYTGDWEVQRMAQALISLLDVIDGAEKTGIIPTSWVRQTINRFLWRDL